MSKATSRRALADPWVLAVLTSAVKPGPMVVRKFSTPRPVSRKKLSLYSSRSIRVGWNSNSATGVIGSPEKNGLGAWLCDGFGGTGGTNTGGTT